MKLNCDQIQRGLIDYIDAEIGGKATGFQKFMTYFVAGSINGKIPDMISKFRGNTIVNTLGIIDESGNIDIDILYKNAKDAARRSGSFTLYGIIFDESDIEKLYEYMRSAK